MESVSPTTMNRARLRFSLIASAVSLLVIALFAYAFFGIVWALAPLAVSALAFAMSLGRMSRRSLSLFWQDFQLMLGDAPSKPPSHEVPTTSQENVAPSTPSSGITEIEETDAPAYATPIPASPLQVSPITALGISERQIGGLLFILGLLAAAFSLYMFPKGAPNALAWWSFALSVALTLAAVPAFEGGWSAFIARFRRGYRVSFEPRGLLPWAALGAILLFALLVRLYNLDGFPPGLWFDEADNIDQAKHIADNPASLTVYNAWSGLPSLLLLPIALVIKFAGISITTGRLVAVAFGLAGIVAIFLMARIMGGILAGLVAAFLTAVTRWDITWARVGMHGITAPLFAALTAWLTYRALKRERAVDFALAGASMGLGMWFYSPFRLFPIVIGFVLLHALAFAGSGRRRLLLNIGVMALFSVIVTLPLIQFAATHPDEFFRRTEVTSLFSHVSEEERVGALASSLWTHLKMFHIEGDPNGRHNIPREPMLDLLSGLLMLFGLAIAVARWRKAAYIVLPVWILVMIMPGVLTIPWEAPQSLRSITVIPAVIALIAIAIGFLWNVGRSIQLPLARVGTACVVAVLLAAIAYTNINAYFGQQANDPDVYSAYSTDETLMARDLAEQATRGYSPMVSRQFRHSLVASLFGFRFPRQTIGAPANIPLNSDAVWRGAAIYLEPRESGFYDTLKAYYPDADYAEIRPPTGGDVMYYAMYISSEELEAAQGIISRRTAADGEVVEEMKRSTESVWALETYDQDGTFAVEWAGALHITHPGEYEFMLDSDSPATVVLDGKVILSENGQQVTVEPAVGLHMFEVRSKVDNPDGILRLLWKQPPPPIEDDLDKEENAGEPQFKPITASNLYHGDVRPVGLAGRYFKGIDDANEIDGAIPDAMQITPGIGGAFWYNSVVDGAHLAVWDGNLNVPMSGRYRFKFGEVRGEMRISLDGETLLDTRGEREREKELLEGRHSIRLEYQTGDNSPLFEILWTPPKQPESRITPEYLTPAPEHMFRAISGK
ncbi:MAG: hypothetical protein F4X57_09915 [Chloroflexi bacterium]|nr:hypothetical protein [Chloroflexota bacterium]